MAFAPPDALRRQMEAAERLVHEIEDAATYPFEFVMWKLTGFRQDEGAIKPLPGRLLRGDLVTFVLHLSERVLMTHQERPGGAIALSDLAGELGVAEKTLRRWRDRGLVAHRIELPDGRVRVGVFRESLARFTSRHRELVGDAATFSRLGGAAESAALARIAELVHSGQTPNLAAKRVATEIGRSHETIRQLLLRASPPSGRAGEGGPARGLRGDRASRRSLDRRSWDRRLAYRAWRFGIAVERVAETVGGSADAVRRRIDGVRAERLRALRLAWVEFPTFERSDAAETILASAAARNDLAPALDPTDAMALLAAFKRERAMVAVSVHSDDRDEEAALAAFNFLKRDARRRIVGLGKAPARSEIDRIETNLRWALRLKRRLVERLLPLAMLRAEQATGSVDRRPAEEVRSLLERIRRLLSEVIEAVDPGKRQSLRRLAALDIDRMLAQHPPTRGSLAAVRREPGAMALPDLFEGLVVWEELLDPFRRLRPIVSRLPESDARLLARRFGWDGGPPATLEELATAERTTVARITKRLVSAERALRGAARSEWFRT